MRCLTVLLAAIVSLPSPLAAAQAQAAAAPAQASSPADYILLTVFLKHDQSKSLDQINKELEASQFWKQFPPDGIEVASWYVMMGIGQVVTLRVPPSRLREVNLAVERSAWGAFRTEFYTTYDYRELARQRRTAATMPRP